MFDSARDEPDLACVVLTGAGDKYFAAGGDLRDLAQVRTEQGVCAMVEEARAALDAVRTFPLPVVAVLNGDALGGGAELALACDLRVMREGASIGYVQGRLAITTGWGGGTDLATVIGADARAAHDRAVRDRFRDHRARLGPGRCGGAGRRARRRGSGLPCADPQADRERVAWIQGPGAGGEARAAVRRAPRHRTARIREDVDARGPLVRRRPLPVEQGLRTD